MQAYKPKLGDLVRIKSKLNKITLYIGLLIDSIHDSSTDPGLHKILVFASYRPASPKTAHWFDLNNSNITIELIQSLEKSNTIE
jgi:hypothetical protein